MRFKLTETQTVAYRQAFYGDKRVIVFGGAIRGGKTYWLLLTLTSLCLTYPRSRWAVIRKSLPDLNRTTFPSFASIMMDGVSNYVKNWNRETNVITFTNGSELIFMAESFDDDDVAFQAWKQSQSYELRQKSNNTIGSACKLVSCNSAGMMSLGWFR